MFTKYESGAEVDIEEVYRYESGAEVEAEGVYAYKNGAEEEVWSAIKWMKELANTMSIAWVGYGHASMHDSTMWCVYVDNGTDGGYVTYYLEGDFKNPTVSFDWHGYFNYETSSGEIRYASAGSISLYTRTKSGTTNYPPAVSDVGTSRGSDEGTFSTTLSGEFDRIGFKIDLNSWNSTRYPCYSIDIWNFLIDGKECLPSADCES